MTAGGGATEIELARQVAQWAETHPGLEQYFISKLYAAHSEGNKNMGFDIDGESGDIKDCLESNVLDLMLAKKWALKYATNAACTVLRVDQIIMAKRAGGPKPR